MHQHQHQQHQPRDPSLNSHNKQKQVPLLGSQIGQSNLFETLINRINQLSDMFKQFEQYLPLLQNLSNGKLPFEIESHIFMQWDAWMKGEFQQKNNRQPLPSRQNPQKPKLSQSNSAKLPVLQNKSLQSTKSKQDSKDSMSQRDLDFRSANYRIAQLKQQGRKQEQDQEVLKKASKNEYYGYGPKTEDEQFQSNSSLLQSNNELLQVENKMEKAVENNKQQVDIEEVDDEQSISQLKTQHYECSLCHLSNWKSTIRTQCHHLFCDPCFNNRIILQIDQNATKLTCPCCSAKLSQQILQQVDNQFISQLFKSKLIANQLQKIKMHDPTKYISCMTQNCQYFCVKGKQQQQTQFYCPLCLDSRVQQ